MIMEVNCETDFVARSDDFCDLVELLCMQLTVFPDLRFISATQVCSSGLRCTLRELGAHATHSVPASSCPSSLPDRCTAWDCSR